ncbi:MAG: PDZ domain-containing protein [Candidatus Nanopelagicales bacterium]|nr:PDZ domain-containing protein [Candidatus Nanopelagicales bacterium]
MTEAPPPGPTEDGSVLPLQAPAPLGWADRVAGWFGFEAPRTPRQRARRRAISRGLVAGVGFLVVVSIVRIPLLILTPGPTYNTIGEVAGQPLIEISGTTTFPTEGALDMTTVSERGGSSGGVFLGEALVGWVSPAASVVPRESVYAPDVSREEISQRNDQLFALSQSDSIAAAMNELELPTEQAVVVTLVSGGSPADGVVQAGDQVLTVNGTPVTGPSQVGDAVRAGSIGDTVALEVLRTPEGGGEPQEVALEVVTEANPVLAAEDPSAPAVPYLGITVGTQYTAPFPIEFTLDDVGGPSAGMMFSLAIVDLLTEGPITGGGHVAGTGTIDPDGTVGPIGGIRQKLVGARDAGAGLFLAPADNCGEADGHEPDGLTVVPIRTLGEARDTVERWAADPETDFPTCAEVGTEAAAGAGR